VSLHVLHPSVPNQYGHFGVPEFSRAMARDARERLLSILEAQNLKSDVLVTVGSKSVHDEILRVASEVNADLIVMGATRRTALRRRLLGSTALRVSRRSHLPVFILPAGDVKRDLSTLDQAVLGWAA
jgi:nucleotide-binding universal stress UspA family protein